LRLDRFLFFIRLVKSRTIAQHLIDEGHVRVDGKRIGKSSEEVRVGSIVALPLRGDVRILRVLALPERRGPAAEARACYEELTGADPRPSEAGKGAADQ
jgi:ribosome-associated heat shock protein Hsp15